ncbi:VC0807 family protein [Chitinasiproducens palmae]|uniref:Transmembrane protein n=1 Tax=Chitinasiproducens palmae TaxID=1770053 RepID=A0A1H2PVY0_9BURK|nr:VC0807 family protein [Chitinasiproducens palmae]SDV51522.1 hypothetical protein SAMN05216551_11828 [Chitinasiproducens palmae]
MKPRRGLLLEVLVNFGLPWLLYKLAVGPLGSRDALLLSALPPVLWAIWEFARNRRLDALSALVVIGIAASLLALALGGSPRLLLMRESLASGAIGLAFLLSLMMPRPLVFHLGRATVAREMDGGAARFEQLWDAQPGFRRSIRLMTLVWGIGLTGENLLRAWLAWHWPVDRYLAVSPAISYGIYGALAWWTLWYRRRMKHKHTVATARRPHSIR